MCMGILPACMSMYHAHAWSLQMLESLGLELQMVMNYCVDSGNQTHVLQKGNHFF